MKIFLLLLCISSFLYSCTYSKECKESEKLVGSYILDTNVVSSYNNNNKIMLLVRQNNWDKINLIVKKGSYHFQNCDDFFRRYEGTWKYVHLGIDGDCYIFINQKQLSRDIPLSSFNIAIEYGSEKIVLPFKKNR